jgi:hypothetical protein
MAITATTLAIASIAVAAVGTAAGTYSSVASANAAEDSAKYDAQVNRNNAVNAQNQAKYEADRIRKRNLLVLGKQRAGFSKSGVELTGSAEDVIYDSAIEGELDRQAALYSGKLGASAYTARARLRDAEAVNAKTGGYFNAGASILGGSSDVISAGNRYVRATNDPTLY